MKSKEFRSSPLILRNEFPTTDLGMPVLKKVQLPKIDGCLSYHDTRIRDKRAEHNSYLIHFFKDDYRFEYLYEKPYGRSGKAGVQRLAQYSVVCTPDFSLFPEMPIPVQMHQVFKSRWCGAYWQSLGFCTVPTVTWSNELSFPFCFNSLPVSSVVAISMVGCKKYREAFMIGYNKMMEVLMPETIICFGEPFDEMEGNIIKFSYRAFDKEA